MEEPKPKKITWLGGGIAIGIAAVLDIIMFGLDFILVGFVVNWFIFIPYILGFSLWLALRGAMTTGRGAVLLALVGGGIIPFAITSTVSVMIARIIAQETLAQVSPGLTNSIGNGKPKLTGAPTTSPRIIRLPNQNENLKKVA